MVNTVPELPEQMLALTVQSRFRPPVSSSSSCPLPPQPQLPSLRPVCFPCDVCTQFLLPGPSGCLWFSCIHTHVKLLYGSQLSKVPFISKSIWISSECTFSENRKHLNTWINCNFLIFKKKQSLLEHFSCLTLGRCPCLFPQVFLFGKVSNQENSWKAVTVNTQMYLT